MSNKRGFVSWIGLLLSFVGMAGLVLSIISLLPVNGYNIYTTIITVLRLLEFEKEEWFSQDASLYLIFLGGSCFASILEISVTFIACCRTETNQVDQESCQYNNNNNNIRKNKSWFIRIICFSLLIQIIFSLFGTHILYKLEKDSIPIDIQHNIFISCAILWINYLSMTVFSFILLFASFCILIGTCTQQKKFGHQEEETRPLIV